MEDFMKADIFFFVTTIAVVLVTVLLAIGLVYLILIFKTTKKFVEKVREEGEEMIQDVRDMRFKLRANEGSLRKLGAIFSFIRKMSGKAKRSDTRK